MNAPEFMPVMGFWDAKLHRSVPGQRIPWAMIAPHDEQAKSNHCGQDLVKLASRGGLSDCEALAILENRRWRFMPLLEARAELERRIAFWTAEHERCPPHNWIPSPSSGAGGVGEGD